MEERKKLRSHSLNRWIDLHNNYDDVVDVVTDLWKKDKLLIATLKDKESVKLILKKENIFIQDNDILDQSQIDNKLDALNFFVEERKLQKKDLCFIDDNVTHLLDPKLNGYNVFLANWGNNIPEYLKIADSNGIKVLENINEEDFNV